MADGPTRKSGWGRLLLFPWTFLLELLGPPHAGTRDGSSTIEKRTPAL